MAKKAKDKITFKVWVCIEAFNERTESGEEMDAPGAAVATFDSYKEAWTYAEKLNAIGESDLDAVAQALNTMRRM